MSKEPSLSHEIVPAETPSEPSPTTKDAPPAPKVVPNREEALAQGRDGTSLDADVEGAPPEVAKCDVCDAPLSKTDDDDDGVGGHGLYVWVRHGQVVYEEPPLCAACASAITLSALRRWDLEEDEG